MDGDASAKTMDKGASSAMAETEHASGIFEASKPRQEPLGEKTTGSTSVFDKDGAIGKQFTETGAIGGTAAKVGGPFDAQGAIGSKFTEKGSIGGAVQEHLGTGESTSIDKSK
ncbi:hypothetical protein MRB53_038647 [Persea americana]|nr:hypothetical protein MRB53_038647 [Persea americana]